MKVRFLDSSDYDILVEWWKFWRFQPPTREVLPNNGLSGIVIESEEYGMICSGFLYITNSPISWIEFIVSNPLVKDKNTRNKALLMLIDELTLLAKNNGSNVIYSSLKNENLINKYLDSGFVKGGINATEMIKKIWE